MSNYANLISGITSVIKTNGQNSITGQLLQNELLSIVNTLGHGYQYMGVANPSTNPGTPDAKVFYIAYQPGTYSNFGGTVVSGLCTLKYDIRWQKEDISVSGGGGTTFTPNAEDLELVNSVLQFTNRVNPTNTNGLGYKILRTDSSFASQVSDQNTIYEIRYDFDINGATVNLPAGSVLNFVGGSIGNGTIVCDNAQFIGKVLFKDGCALSGTIVNTIIYSNWFATFNNFVTACNNLSGYSKIEVKKGNYTASVGFEINHDVDMDFNNSHIDVADSVLTFIKIGNMDTPTISTKLSAAAGIGDYSISVQDGSAFKRGDILFLRDETTSSYNDYRNYQEGEIVVVDYVDNNTIYLTNGLFGTYKQANLANCYVYKKEFTKASIRNLDAKSLQTRESVSLSLITGLCLIESVIENITAINFDISVSLSASYNCSIKNCDLTAAEQYVYQSTDINQYCVAVSNSQLITVENISGSAANHICAIGGSYSDWYAIVSRIVSFSHCIGKSRNPGFPGMNVHGDGEYVTFYDCYTNGMDVGGNHITIKKCRLFSDTRGRSIRLNEITGFDIKISDCDVYGSVTNSNHFETKTVNHYADLEEFVIQDCFFRNFVGMVILNVDAQYQHYVNFIFQRNTVIGAAGETRLFTNAQEYFTVKFINNLIYNYGVNFSCGVGLEMVGNTIINTVADAEIIRLNARTTPSPLNFLIFKNNTIRNKNTNLDFRFNSMGAEIGVIEFSNNFIESIDNVNGVSTTPTSGLATVFIFKNNVLNSNKNLYICGVSVYTGVTPTLGTGIVYVYATNLYDGNFVNKTGENNVISAHKGTQAYNMMVRGRQIGLTSGRPTGVGAGSIYFDTYINSNIEWNGSKWVDLRTGYSPGLRTNGTTLQRPSPSSDDAGFQYYDSTLKKIILWNGTSWVNIDGTALS